MANNRFYVIFRAVDALRQAQGDMDAVDAVDVERSDIPANAEAVDAVDAVDVERSDIPANAGAVDALR